MVDTDDDHTGALFFDLKTGNATGFRLAGDHDVYALHWLDEDRVLVSQSHERLYADGLFVVDSRDVHKYYAVERYSQVQLIAVPDSAPMKPIIWIRQDAFHDGNDAGAVVIDAWKSSDRQREPGVPRMRMLEDDDAVGRNGTAASILHSYPAVAKMTEAYVADAKGELAFALTIDHGAERLLYLERGKWLPSPIDMDQYDLVGAGDVPGEVIAVGPRRDHQPRALVRVDARSGAVAGTLYEDKTYDPEPERLIRDPKTRKIVGVQLFRGALETIWFDADHQALQRSVARAFPGKAVSYLGSDRDENRFIYAVFSDRQPVAYYSINVATKELGLIADSAPWLKNATFAATQVLQYTTRDGRQIEGFLTLPAGASKTHPAPMVVLVHGGPWAHDEWQFNPEVQFLATRGYAVFQPNYRGSTGYGWRFPAGDGWEFMKMHYDVTDGVHRLLKTGLIDPHRVAIMGASFGGYLAMCGAAYEPDLYRCAITEAGVFDWSLMMQQARRDQFESARYQLFSRYLGDPKKDAAWFAEISPLNHIDRVKIPVLVTHGRSDEVVDIEQSKRLIEKLRANHVAYQSWFVTDEGHGLSRLENRVKYYTTVETFLQQNLQPIAAVQPAGVSKN